MGIVATIITISLLAISLFALKGRYRFTNPLIFFLTLWSLILFLSLFHLFDLDAASNQAYILLIIMISAFTTGYFLYLLISVKKKPKPEQAAKTSKQPELPSLKESFLLKVLFGIIIISIILNLVDYFIGLKYIMDGLKPWQVRNWTLAPFGSSNPILDRRSFVEEIFRAFVASPVAIMLPAIAAYYFFASNKKKTRNAIVALSIVSLITSSLAGGGGRIGYIYFGGCFTLAYFILRRNNMLRKVFNTKRLVIAVALCVLAIVGLTVFRTSIDDIAKQVYTYIALPPALLSKWLPFLGASGFTFGLTTLFGIHSYGFRSLKMIGLGSLVPAAYTLAETNVFNAEKYLAMDAGGIYNAFVTPVYYFMCDCGVIAVVVFSLSFGLICAYVYKRLCAKLSLRSFLLYILAFYGIFLSFSRIQTVTPTYIIAIVFTIIFVRRGVHAKASK